MLDAAIARETANPVGVGLDGPALAQVGQQFVCAAPAPATVDQIAYNGVVLHKRNGTISVLPIRLVDQDQPYPTWKRVSN
jgi:hypothetical protein